MKRVISLEKLFYVSDSTIHGKGLFAKTRIDPGAYLGTYDGPETDENDSHVLWVELEDGIWTGRDGQNLLRYINHSDEPCAEFQGFELYALDGIGTHQEVTIDYGDEFTSE